MKYCLNFLKILNTSGTSAFRYLNVLSVLSKIYGIPLYLPDRFRPDPLKKSHVFYPPQPKPNKKKSVNFTHSLFGLFSLLPQGKT